MRATLLEVLHAAQKHGYAVPAFNINNMEICQAVVRAAVAEKSPVILQTSEGAVSYAGLPWLAALADVAFTAPVPVVFHVDHGKDLRLVKELIRSGRYTSVMFDGSKLDYAANVRGTREVVRLAHARGMSVEAELGAIAGTEDSVSVSAREAFFTDPAQAEAFVEKTGCDALAVSVGTAHGAYKFSGKTVLDFERLGEIAWRVHVPLVLHGASGVPAALVRRAEKFGARLGGARGVSDAACIKAISLGVCKINIDTDLRLAFTTGVRQALRENPTDIDPRHILRGASELMTDLARHKMRLFGSSGKARGK